MNKTLHYLFDPLCGWCYGATPAVADLLGTPGIAVNLLPTGLFSGQGARAMDDAFANFAWSNDQRIERLTGQRFSERYRERVLGQRPQRFDSGPASLALTAVSLLEPTREFEALQAIQRARYVDGGDVVSLPALAELLRAIDLKEAGARIAQPDEALLGAHRERVSRAQALMQQVGARGVPSFIAGAGTQRRVLDHGAALSDPAALLRQLPAA